MADFVKVHGKITFLARFFTIEYFRQSRNFTESAGKYEHSNEGSFNLFVIIREI